MHNLSAGKGSVHASINRRARNGYSDAVTPEFPKGTVDPNLDVVRFDGLDGMPVAVSDQLMPAIPWHSARPAMPSPRILSVPYAQNR